MELPPLLRRNVDRALSGVGLADLAVAAAALSQRYRDEHRGDRPHVRSERDALAYIAVRLPATYAAVRASFAAVAEQRPDFAPKTYSTLAQDREPRCGRPRIVGPISPTHCCSKRVRFFAAAAKRSRAGQNLPRLSWRVADIAAGAIDFPPCDVVSLAYVLNELAPAVRQSVLKRLWDVTADMLVIVEPGTPAGWARILAARRQLIEAGAHVLAPCPHASACPLQVPDWCHFAERVARSRLHRLAKEAEVPWEDEKFSYVALSRRPAAAGAPRVIARPRKGSGRVILKLCRPDGSAGETLFSRRDGNAFKRAWRSDWGYQIDLDAR